MALSITSTPSEQLKQNMSYPPLWNNLWTFEFKNLGGEWTYKDYTLYPRAPKKTKVTNVSLPVSIPKFSTENIQNGQRFYSSIDRGKTLTVDFREDIAGSVYQFFSLWADAIYDRINGYYKTGDNTLDGELCFYRYSVNRSKLYSLATDFIKQDKALSAIQGISQTVTNKINTAIESAVGGLGSSFLSGVERTGGNVLTSAVNSLTNAREVNSSFLDSIGQLYTIGTSLVFQFKNMYLQSVEDQSLSYSKSPDVVTWKATMAPEEVTFYNVVEMRPTSHGNVGALNNILGRIL